MYPFRNLASHCKSFLVFWRVISLYLCVRTSFMAPRCTLWILLYCKSQVLVASNWNSLQSHFNLSALFTFQKNFSNPCHSSRTFYYISTFLIFICFKVNIFKNIWSTLTFENTWKGFQNKKGYGWLTKFFFITLLVERLVYTKKIGRFSLKPKRFSNEAADSVS